MAYFGYSPAYNNNQLLGSPSSSSGAMSGSTSPNGVTTSPGTSCCEGGRPLVTDPVTGQSVCSCQYDPARLTLSSYPRLTAYPPAPYAPPTEQNPYPTLESSAFYSPLGGAYAGLKEGSGTGDVSCWPNPGTLQSGYYPYDPTFAAAYGYGGGYDLAARRKNATRESTATLKAWLNEHKKNPYPTKGEKIMLAIITKMTLTQVSTWFANARRRLKKENKMTWEPKNKTDDDDDDIKDDDDDDSSHGPSSSPGLTNNNSIGVKNDPSSDLKSDCAATSNKPKIWSLADTAACKTPPPQPHPHALSHGPHGHHLNHSGHHNPGHGPHHGHPPPPVTSSWSFALPSYRYGSFLTPVASEGVGTDTPPQTPPNLKVPTMLSGSLSSHFNPSAANSSGLTSSADLTTTAFKPVLKSSSGGFCV
ncbi:unnamed protein product [Allacma fusca]|uniref:Homeobox domain-containing protein n=1 Tax=Allacma fusca TaxID=39272 RepID=A0A8J2JUK2_9HEXA|nr:unnamed protein product [Allacma fusca]